MNTLKVDVLVILKHFGNKLYDRFCDGSCDWNWTWSLLGENDAFSVGDIDECLFGNTDGDVHKYLITSTDEFGDAEFVDTFVGL